MTWVKKVNPDWNPQEHPGILVGDVVDFPGNVERLLAEGSVALCDAQGNTVSQYDVTGVPSNQELEDFKAWREMQQQEALKKSLESERDTLLAEAEAIKAQTASATAEATTTPVGTVETAQAELDQKKKEWAAKMAAARAAKAAERAGGTDAQA
jgi:hypothetical protein